MDPIPDREAARGHFGSPADIGLDGLARQRRYIAGERRPPAVHHLTGMAPTHVAPGRCTFSMPASPWLVGPLGTIHGGVLAIVADAPLSGAIITEIGAGQIVTTAEISLAFVRPALPAAGTLVANATTIHAGANLGLSSCEVTDADGRLLAHATARNVVLDAPDGWEDYPDEQRPVDGAATYDKPEPWQRPVEGSLVPLEVWEERPGLELAQAWCAGELDWPPIGMLTGGRPEEAEEGRSAWSAPTSRWWCSPAPFLYGGMLAYFAETALSSSFQTVTPAGRIGATLDLVVRFLRPVFPDTGTLRARAEVVQRGRNLVVSRCTIRDGEDRPVVLAEASAAMVPPAALLRDQPEPGTGLEAAG